MREAMLIGGLDHEEVYLARLAHPHSPDAARNRTARTAESFRKLWLEWNLEYASLDSRVPSEESRVVIIITPDVE